MDFEQAERRFKELHRGRQRGDLDEERFRVEVAKLLFRDEQGVFWMLDADSGAWVCNRGEGWAPGDPHAERPGEAGRPAGRRVKRRRLGRLLALGAVLIALLGVAGVVALQQGWVLPRNPRQPTPIPRTHVQVTIASPADGSQVALGQVVPIESTIDADPDLQGVGRVDLVVNDQTVDSQPVQPRVQPGQASLPLSQPWRPAADGKHEVTVTAFSAEGDPLGSASITLQVAETSDESLPEPACIPDAAFVGDVTIPPGSAFPPGARMDKVWQVRNSSSCAWGVGYELVLLEGEALGAPAAVPVPPTAAGEGADLTVTFWAPPEVGAYANAWQLRSPEGQFFGPTLPLTIRVEILAEESSPPTAPANLQASVTQDGTAVRLTWEDQSDNEDAFRIYREDVEASIGLVPANAQLFVDTGVTCGHTYRYHLVVFNAAGTSPESETAEVALPPCAPTDAPPTLTLSVVPTQVLPSEAFTITFEANDDLGIALVIVWGDETGDPVLDTGRVFTCAEVVCTRTWPITWTGEISVTLTLVGIARDSSGHESEPTQSAVEILPPD